MSEDPYEHIEEMELLEMSIDELKDEVSKLMAENCRITFNCNSQKNAKEFYKKEIQRLRKQLALCKEQRNNRSYSISEEDLDAELEAIE